ncbi:hypothetical protein fugu_002548 [Takifugu bimaculatus]|uniref:Sodium/myo-inositol cotransporter n=1 Tax=Takifugu bimaculatus TaxID=433685 RepID=A0A4Z2BR38_9TELE|nr:hypothetical protein fugu_002548 [Takifugu bimaculatus]
MTWAACRSISVCPQHGSEHFIGLAGLRLGAGKRAQRCCLGTKCFNSAPVIRLDFYPSDIQSGVYYNARIPGQSDTVGDDCRCYFAVLSLSLYIFTKLSVDLYAGALFIQESLGWDLYLSIILLIAMTALLTVTGGSGHRLYTDTIQAVLMISGALCLAGISLSKVGGIQGVWTKYMAAAPNITAILLSSPNLTYSKSCFDHVQPKPDSLRILRGLRNPDIPWPGFLLGQTPASIWYWCTDQVIVQRVLAAKNIVHAKGSTIMAGCLKILPLFVIVIPGMIARILFADELACISPEHCMQVCGSTAGCSNMAYPRLVMSVMPPGLRGLIMAVMIAALMSELDSIFNSSSTIFTLDIYKMIRKQASSLELMIVGRLFVVFIVIISIAWVPVIIEMQGGQMFYYIQEVSDYLTPPIAALFLLGILWHRCNETGAFWGGMVGFTLGVSRLGLAFVYREPYCDQPDERPYFIKDVNFMYVAAILFWVSGIVAVIVSLCTPPPKKEQIRNTTLWGFNRRKKLRQQEEERNELGANALRLLDNGLQDGSRVEETPQDCPNKCNNFETGHTVTQSSISHAGTTRHNEANLFQNGRQPETSEAIEVRGMGDREEEEEETMGCLTEAGDGMCIKVLQRFCGLEMPSKDAIMSAQEQEKTVDELLYEAPRVRLMLNIAMVAIVSTGVFLLIYFSI